MAVGAASIIAKTKRDLLIEEINISLVFLIFSLDSSVVIPLAHRLRALTKVKSIRLFPNRCVGSINLRLNVDRPIQKSLDLYIVLI